MSENRLRGSKQGASGGRKTSRRHAAASLGVALISNFLRRGSKGIRMREVGVQIGNPR